MSNNNNNNDSRPPLQPREGQYQPVTTWNLKPVPQQIITLILMVIILIFHSTFVISPLFAIDHSILYIMFAIHFLLLILIAIYYIRITRYDPVDRCIINQSFRYTEFKKINVKYCILCRSDVMIRSYHCKRCNRCTQCFDHHCIYMNTCIGRRNYEMFMTILIMFILFHLNVIGQSIWVFVVINQLGQEQTNAISRWGIIPLILLCLGTFIASLVLCIFHLQISCFLDVTTLEMIQSEEANANKANEITDIKNQKTESQLKTHQYL